MKYRSPKQGLREWRPAESQNISLGGLKLEGNFLTMGRHDQIEVRFVASGKVVNCDVAVLKTGRSYLTGVFSTISQEARSNLAQFIYAS